MKQPLNNKEIKECVGGATAIEYALMATVTLLDLNLNSQALNGLYSFFGDAVIPTAPADPIV